MGNGMKIFLGISGLAIVITGVVLLRKKLSMPSLESYDNLKKKVTWKFNGETKTSKVFGSTRIALGDSGYIIWPMLDGDNVVGVYLKSGDKIVDSLKS